ncbi:response regulator [Methylobacterium radiotolerans]|uniref:response regulator n=1 Tax=Methylobacterium TaxID=407 RepID=UPI0005B85BB2|nr:MULTISPECIES: response regulator [Methylobacterium]KIU37273.1 histidine kinase [Methylobacterium radiotolerans]KTS10661.1 histidine kinase [Methylobacterium radiotolerans]KTS43999.1 histidine kinase [Methylobacterium radiotolerans]ONF48914.1 histidine kinase [Methylobacterium radiotolerans]PJI54665.1 response regulator [Methylobacterium radiotolerans]
MKRILIVEDVALNRDLLTQLLEDEYEILIAVDGAAGVDMAIAHRPDLILMDLSLPLVDGWEATRRIKANATTSAIPVMAITANAMTGDEDRARAAGCDDFMTKPVDEDLLFAKLQHWLG